MIIKMSFVRFMFSFCSRLQNKIHARVFLAVVLLSYDLISESRPTVSNESESRKSLTHDSESGVIAISDEFDLISSSNDFYFPGNDFHNNKNDFLLGSNEWNFLLQLLDVLGNLLGNDFSVNENAEFLQNDQPLSDEGVRVSLQELPDSEITRNGYQPEIQTFDRHLNDGYRENSSAVNFPVADDQNKTVDVVKMDRDRSKALRIRAIKNQILMSIGGVPSGNMKNLSSNQQTDIIRMLFENVKSIPQWPSDSYAKKTQSYYPSCTLPRRTSKEEWFNGTEMNIYFNMTFPESPPGSTLNIVTAQLRLYKLPYQVKGDGEITQASPPVELEEAIKHSNLPESIASASIMAALSQEKQMRVSVYFYTRSLTKRKVKKTLVASGMLSLYGEHWTEWNIRKAVNVWKNDSHKNYGLSIAVEDDEGKPLPANKIFDTINCSKQISLPRTMPGFLFDAARETDITNQMKSANKTIVTEWSNMNLYSVQYPMLEVSMIEIPDSQANNAFLYHYTKTALEQRVSDISNNQQASLAAGASSEENSLCSEHRIRHSHHKKIKAIEHPLERDTESISQNCTNAEEDEDRHIIVKAIIPVGMYQLQKQNVTLNQSSEQT